MGHVEDLEPWWVLKSPFMPHSKGYPFYSGQTKPKCGWFSHLINRTRASEGERGTFGKLFFFYISLLLGKRTLSKEFPHCSPSTSNSIKGTLLQRSLFSFFCCGISKQTFLILSSLIAAV